MSHGMLANVSLSNSSATPSWEEGLRAGMGRHVEREDVCFQGQYLSGLQQAFADKPVMVYALERRSAVAMLKALAGPPTQAQASAHMPSR
jgi:hypothetical protein